MGRILLTPLAPEVLEIAQRLLPVGFALEIAAPDEATLLSQVERADFLVGFVGRLPPDFYQRAGRLQLIQLLSAGYDGIEIERARAAGVLVATNGGANAISVAEHAVMLMLAVYRRLIEMDRQVRRGGWRSAPLGAERTYELAGKTVGILGLGNIGREVARRLRCFDVRLLYYDPLRRTPDEEQALGVCYAPFDEVLQQADIVTLHLPLSPATRGLIGRREFALMKTGTVLINTARGELVDEAALIEALESGRLLGAGLDTLAQEPPPPDHPLLRHDRVVLTPHSAGPTWDSWPRRFANAFANVERVARGEAPWWVIPELRDGQG